MYGEDFGWCRRVDDALNWAARTFLYATGDPRRRHNEPIRGMFPPEGRALSVSEAGHTEGQHPDIAPRGQPKAFSAGWPYCRRRLHEDGQARGREVGTQW